MNQQEKTKANVKQAVPFFGVSDIERSVRYYVDGLGFTMRYKVRNNVIVIQTQF